jgi:hypothetical protein
MTFEERVAFAATAELNDFRGALNHAAGTELSGSSALGPAFKTYRVRIGRYSER